MSSRSTTVTEKHFAYLAERTRGEDEFLKELKREARAAGIPPIWISPEQASLMQILLKLLGARRVVEVGTLAGYSAIVMARALPADGMVRTVEVEPQHAAFARAWVGRSDVAGRVEVIEGNGREVLPAMDADSADACFIDADKEGYRTYLDECLRIVRSGGLVMVDNAFAFGRLFAAEGSGERDDAAATIRAFNDYMAGHPDLHGIIVPVGDGCWVGVRRR